MPINHRTILEIMTNYKDTFFRPAITMPCKVGTVGL